MEDVLSFENSWDVLRPISSTSSLVLQLLCNRDRWWNPSAVAELFSDLLDPNFKLLFFGVSRSSSPLALVLEVGGPEGLLKKEVIFDICNESNSSKSIKNNKNTRMRRCGKEPQGNSAGQWLTKTSSSQLSICCFICLRCLPYIPSCIRTAFSKCFGNMDDSNSQAFASGLFSHSQIIKITRILWVCER